MQITNEALYDALVIILKNNSLLEIARIAIEKKLVQLREERISQCRNNGFCIKEANGELSSIIRLGAEDSMSVGLEAIAEAIRKDMIKQPAYKVGEKKPFNNLK